jgi:hypothetical protein
LPLYNPQGRFVEEVVYGVQLITSLDAVSAATDGAPLDNPAARVNHLAAITVSEGVTGGEVALQGSLASVNWFVIGTPETLTSADASTTVPITAVAPVQFVRASVVTAIARRDRDRCRVQRLQAGRGVAGTPLRDTAVVRTGSASVLAVGRGAVATYGGCTGRGNWGRCRRLGSGW